VSFRGTIAGFWVLLAGLGVAASAGAAESSPSTGYLDLSLEELMNIEVTSVSKKEEKLANASAAIYVITQDDIRRSGHQRIPELLRMVPGLQVARIDANKWAISSRGFNGNFANKLLVLIDGRSVYTPVFSGVFWDIQDALLEDVERIEVIRGPGATMWGANAVNGVINIITKSAKDTQGGLIMGGGGSEELAFGGARYGGKLRNDIHYRVYGKYYNHDDFVDAMGNDAADEWQMGQGGMRIDWDISPEDLFTAQSDLYAGESGATIPFTQTVSPPFVELVDDVEQVFGGNLLTRWTRRFSETSEAALQAYYSYDDRKVKVVDMKIHTLDLDFQHYLRLAERHTLTWGLGYRLVLDDFDNHRDVVFDPEKRDIHLISSFLQYEMAIVPERLRFTLGTKLEYNQFTGIEVQPSTRLQWTPHPRHAVWGAISRAVRTPNRAEEDIQFNLQGGPGTVGRAYGNSDFRSEELWAFEAGYRLRPWDRLTLDAASFYNIYDSLLSFEFAGTPFLEGSTVVVPLEYDNQLYGETYGVEIAGNFQVNDWCRLSASYTFLRMQLHRQKSSTSTLESAEGQSPHHQVNARSTFNLPGNVELDFLLYYVDDLPAGNIPSYVRFDVRLGWRPWPDLELSAGAQNLFDTQHPEFGAEPFTSPTEVERAFYGKLVWRF